MLHYTWIMHSVAAGVALSPYLKHYSSNPYDYLTNSHKDHTLCMIPEVAELILNRWQNNEINLDPVVIGYLHDTNLSPEVEELTQKCCRLFKSEKRQTTLLISFETYYHNLRKNTKELMLYKEKYMLPQYAINNALCPYIQNTSAFVVGNKFQYHAIFTHNTFFIDPSVKNEREIEELIQSRGGEVLHGEEQEADIIVCADFKKEFNFLNENVVLPEYVLECINQREIIDCKKQIENMQFKALPVFGFAKREVKVEIDCTNFNKLPEYAAVANILRRLQFKVSVPGAQTQRSDFYFSLESPALEKYEGVENLVGFSWLRRMLARGQYEFSDL